MQALGFMAGMVVPVGKPSSEMSRAWAASNAWSGVFQPVGSGTPRRTALSHLKVIISRSSAAQLAKDHSKPRLLCDSAGKTASKSPGARSTPIYLLEYIIAKTSSEQAMIKDDYVIDANACMPLSAKNLLYEVR